MSPVVSASTVNRLAIGSGILSWFFAAVLDGAPIEIPFSAPILFYSPGPCFALLVLIPTLSRSPSGWARGVLLLCGSTAAYWAAVEVALRLVDPIGPIVACAAAGPFGATLVAGLLAGAMRVRLQRGELLFACMWGLLGGILIGTGVYWPPGTPGVEPFEILPVSETSLVDTLIGLGFTLVGYVGWQLGVARSLVLPLSVRASA